MAFNQLIDGNVRVLGTTTVSSLTVSNGMTLFSGSTSQGSLTTSTATQGAVTVNARSFRVTTGALSTGVNLSYVLTITNSVVSATDILFGSVANGSNTSVTGPYGPIVTAGNGVVTFTCWTVSHALNGTLIFNYSGMRG